jgi:competence ComEA-like helix-hairpin-helix protein
MNRLRLWIKFWFGFSRTESNAFVILVPLLLLLIFSEPIYRAWFVSQPASLTPQENVLDSVLAAWQRVAADSSAPEPLAFNFDPNTASVAQLEALGFGEQVAARIMRYREKGGRFREAGDLAKIYGIDSARVEALRGYIQIATKPSMQTTSDFPKMIMPRERTTAPARFDLNAADTSELKKIYGIGPVLAQRVVKYREKLGGFVAMSQLYEVYGLDSLTISRLVSKAFIDPDFHPVKLNVNEADETELARHPYLKFKFAKAIATYRFQHGKFTGIDDLRKVKMLDSTTVEKLKPYLVW